MGTESEVEGVETVKKQENHPIEVFWNEYKLKREFAAQQKERGSIAGVFKPNSVSPASGQLESNVNLQGKFQSQVKKQEMLDGNFQVPELWAHDTTKKSPVTMAKYQNKSMKKPLKLVKLQKRSLSINKNDQKTPTQIQAQGQGAEQTPVIETAAAAANPTND